MTAFYGPKSALDRKPGHGKPCNGCGLCCMAVPCALSKMVFGVEQGQCPALVQVQDHVYTCGLTTSDSVPENFRDAAKVIIGAGYGCDARFNSEPIDHGFYLKLDKLDATNHDKTVAARKLWREALTNRKP